ncbi:MAG: ATP-binding protein [Peptostreptococcaceae bacterium]|nr:ATP-binding protein [Peptostreptococcaceae bacterium]
MLNSLLFWNILTILSIVIEWEVFKLILDEFGELKNDKIKKYITFILLILITTVLTIGDVNPNIKLFIGIIMGYIFSLYNYKITLLKGITINLVYWMILLGLDAISSSIIIFINSLESIYDLLNDNIFRLELTILTKILLVSIIPILKGLKLKIEFNKIDFINIIIPIAANILSIVVMFALVMNSGDMNYEKNLMILIFSGILFISNISLINIIGSIIRSNNLNVENRIIKEKMDMQYNHYLTVKEEQMKVRKLYHDMNNHISCIQHIYGRGDSAEEYINSIKYELDNLNSVFLTENMILDSILNEKKKICDKNNIELFVDINFDRCEFIEMIDVCSIFSNLLDNAIEACYKIDDKKMNRFIRIKGTIVNKFFVIKCENSKVNEIKLANNNVRTDKKDIFLHGIGISSIKTSVEKYNGEVSIDYSNDNFTAKIYIPLS